MPFPTVPSAPLAKGWKVFNRTRGKGILNSALSALSVLTQDNTLPQRQGRGGRPREGQARARRLHEARRPSRPAPAAPALLSEITIQKMVTFTITLITLIFVVVSGPAMHEA